MTVRIIQGDCREVLATLPAASVHCCVTSPPYFGLRDYQTGTWTGGDPACKHVVGEMRRGLGLRDSAANTRGGAIKIAETPDIMARAECPHCGAVRVDRQIGLEASPAAYVAEMVAVFRDVWRVLRDDGTVWLNIGDSYAANGGYGGGGNSARMGRAFQQRNVRPGYAGNVVKPKDLMLIPARVAIALQEDGWYVRSDIIWSKPNPMPESCTDRPTSAHEHLFLLTKRARYFYDAFAIREASESGPSDIRKMIEGKDRIAGKTVALDDPMQKANANTAIGRKRSVGDASGRNRRNVWTIATQPFPEAHFATFPPDLVEPCILAGTSEGGCCSSCGAPFERIVQKGAPDEAHRRACGADLAGGYAGQSTKGHDAAGVQNASDVKRRILEGMVEKRTVGWARTCDCPDAPPARCVVLDPFSGAGTTVLVADRLQRDAIGIELNPDYAAMTRRRLERDGGLFAAVAD